MTKLVGVAVAWGSGMGQWQDPKEQENCWQMNQVALCSIKAEREREVGEMVASNFKCKLRGSFGKSIEDFSMSK